MLKGIPPILPPDLVKYLMEMGHSEHLTIADAHYPAESYGKRIVRCPGATVPQILDAVLTLMPLDTYVLPAVNFMAVVEGDPIGTPGVWAEMETVIEKHEPGSEIGFLDRYDFYEESKQSFVIVQSGDQAQYANVILRKGIVRS